jgi:hypothetical protein
LQEQKGAYECGEADNFYLLESELKLFLMQYDFANVYHALPLRQTNRFLIHPSNLIVVGFS